MFFLANPKGRINTSGFSKKRGWHFANNMYNSRPGVEKESTSSSNSETDLNKFFDNQDKVICVGTQIG